MIYARRHFHAHLYVAAGDISAMGYAWLSPLKDFVFLVSIR